MTEYRDVIGKTLGAFQNAGEMASEPNVVAEVIYEAATDGTDQLRYTAGADAEMIIGARKAQDDATFMHGIRDQFGL